MLRLAVASLHRSSVTYYVMSRTTLSGFVAASVLFAPSLCVAGLVTHECDCAQRHGCEHESDCGHDHGCRHESDCPDDPCAVVAVRAERQRDDIRASVQMCVVCCMVHPVTTHCVRSAIQTKFLESPFAVNLPYPTSDVPLLI
ncbi:MAG: hypothetical protein JSU86_18865 [Phycisphaerales bacterium]|nr:MAG: hypothetical protein JSU86_18865 [Phycisphaerales bacterium]